MKWHHASYVWASTHSPCISRATYLPGWPISARKSILTSMQLQEEKKKHEIACFKENWKYFFTSLWVFLAFWSFTLSTRPNWQFSWRSANLNHACPDTCRQLLGKGPWLLVGYVISQLQKSACRLEQIQISHFQNLPPFWHEWQVTGLHNTRCCMGKALKKASV